MSDALSIRGRPHPTSRERWCLAYFAVAVVVALWLPAIAQDPAYHAFADQRSLLEVPRAADVLSSVAFTIVGLAAMIRLSSRDRLRFSRTAEASLWLLALGFALTGAGSAFYHSDPRDATLVWDRLPMTLGFAGVLGLAVSQRVGARAAALALPVLAVLGIASVIYWHVSGNVAPYGVVQYGSGLALVLLTAATPRDTDPIRWRWVIAWYVIAKACEVADASIFAATHGVVAGHVLKHFAGAAAGVAAFAPLWRRNASRPT